MMCPDCGVEMKYIRSGVSKKTGRPYNAFFKCESCGGSQNATNSKPHVNPRDAEIKKMYDDKRENIKWLNAINNAVLLICHGKSDKKLYDTALYIYSLDVPNDKERNKIEQKIENQMNGDPFGGDTISAQDVSEDDIPVEKIPF